MYDISQPNDVLSYQSHQGVPQNFMLSDSKSTILPDHKVVDTGRFKGEKPLKPEDLRSLFQDENPKEDYIQNLKNERD